MSALDGPAAAQPDPIDLVARRLARRISAPPAGPDSLPMSRWRNCVVDSIVSGGAADGGTAVFIRNGADVIPAAYLDAAPAAGATVRVEFSDGSPLIHGTVRGNPA